MLLPRSNEAVACQDGDYIVVQPIQENPFSSPEFFQSGPKSSESPGQVDLPDAISTAPGSPLLKKLIKYKFEKVTDVFAQDQDQPITLCMYLTGKSLSIY